MSGTVTSRRAFLRRAAASAAVAAPAIWIPRRASAQLNSPSFVAGLARATVAGGGGESLMDSYQWGGSDDTFQFSQNYYYTACRFTAGASFTLSRMEVWADQVGTPTMTMTPYIYTESGGSPGSVLTGGTGTAIALNTAPPAGSPAAWSLSGFSCALTSGTDYWFVQWFGGSFSNSNLVRIGTKIVGGAGYWTKRSDNPGVSWTNADQNEKFIFRGYGA